MPAAIDLVGRRFSRLVVTALDGVRAKKRYWLCRCDCGRHTVVSGSNLGRCIFSCGCLQREVARGSGAKTRKHGQRFTREYAAWNSARDRCTNPRSHAWHNYGGRGITMCDRWRCLFESFFVDMGECPAGFELDRIDNERGYEPGNCRWTTRSENAKNRRQRERVNGRFVARSVSDIFRELPL